MEKIKFEYVIIENADELYFLERVFCIRKGVINQINQSNYPFIVEILDDIYVENVVSNSDGLSTLSFVDYFRKITSD